MLSQKSQAFRRWVRRRRRLALIHPLPSLITMSGQVISISSAYRAAVEQGVRGRRRNRSRYDRFWKQINWALPDLVLARIWKTQRQNLRQRRRRLRVGPPRWRLPSADADSAYHRAVQRERRR